jgi:hypothetical protein
LGSASVKKFYSALSGLYLTLKKAPEPDEWNCFTKAGKPIARVSAIDSPLSGRERRLGFLRGQFVVPEDFDRLGEEEISRLFGE